MDNIESPKATRWAGGAGFPPAAGGNRQAVSEHVIAERYRLDRLLGRGGTSEVWRATDLELSRQVALKFLDASADSALFEREARAVAYLAHPNVTRLFDFGEADGRPFMVLECLGGSLEDLLREQGRLPDERTLAIARDVAAGLAHAHSRRVVHRDIKPANVLFDQEERAKLSDFGVARLAGREPTLTRSGTIVGTAAYISPEVAAGGSASAASDVYSFGVVLYRMLTGRLPFEADDPRELLRRHRDDEPFPVTDHRRDVPPALATVVAAAMAKDLGSRPPDGAALVDLLGGPPVDRPVTATTASREITQVLTPSPPPPPRPTRDGRGRALLIALLITFAFAGAGLAWVMTSPGSSLPATTQAPPPTRTHPTSTNNPPTTTARQTRSPETTSTHTASTQTHPTAATAVAPIARTHKTPTTTAAQTTAPTTTSAQTTTPPQTTTIDTTSSAATTTTTTTATTTTAPTTTTGP